MRSSQQRERWLELATVEEQRRSGEGGEKSVILDALVAFDER